MPPQSSSLQLQLKDLQEIPGVGRSIARNLIGIGIRKVDDLKGKNPERLYARANRAAGVVQDRCLLYVFRCAVYFASTKRPEPEKLRWWYWKDTSTNGRRRQP